MLAGGCYPDRADRVRVVLMRPPAGLSDAAAANNRGRLDGRSNTIGPKPSSSRSKLARIDARPHQPRDEVQPGHAREDSAGTKSSAVLQTDPKTCMPTIARLPAQIPEPAGGRGCTSPRTEITPPTPPGSTCDRLQLNTEPTAPWRAWSGPTA